MDFWKSPALWVWPPDSCITMASTIRLMQFKISLFPDSAQCKKKGGILRVNRWINAATDRFDAAEDTGDGLRSIPRIHSWEIDAC